MFEHAVNLLIEFINLCPILIPFILIINIVSSLLWGDK